tara:strand:- start:854 stop:1693 length:840 start_codon:yes stop_codon:yes gene_type:complete
MNLKSYLNKAKKGKWAIPQFNFSTLEQLRGILAKAEQLKSPIILGTSQGELNFLGLKEVVALLEISKTKYNVPVFLNLDHGKDISSIKKAIDYGYSAVHFDGSKLSLKENIKLTKQIVDYAHKRGVIVEGELGHIQGESKLNKVKMIFKKEYLTDVDQVNEFVKKTKVDSLAISIGNVHGVYKGRPKIDFTRLKEISDQTNCFLVLHGGSGIFKSDIKKAIKMGIVKINVNTELRMAWKNSLEKSLKLVKPYKVLIPVQNAIGKKVEEKVKLFDSINKK